jgi:hypothetical protein
MGRVVKDNQVSFLGLLLSPTFSPRPLFRRGPTPHSAYHSGASTFLCYALVTLLDTPDELLARAECNR